MKANNSLSRLPETLVILGMTLLILKGLYALKGNLPFIEKYLGAFVGVFLLYVPVIHYSWRKKCLSFFSFCRTNVLRSIKIFLLTSLIVFPLFFLVNHGYQSLFFGRQLSSLSTQGLGFYFLSQVVVTALPEEFFYRGWLQEELNGVWMTRWKILGVEVGWGWLVTAVLFALSHTFITYQWWHFSIFFPALLFGWLREKTGSITAPILLHAVSNCATYLIDMNYS